jgi:RHS repeat-associated protein
VDEDGNSTIDRSAIYVYDGQNLLLQFDRSGSTNMVYEDLSHVYMHGPAVDQVLADEAFYSHWATDESGGDGHYEYDGSQVYWLLGDNQNSIRDVVTHDYWSNTGGQVDHLRYDVFGNITSQTNSGYQPHFTYTGRELDSDTGLYFYRARWYDAKNGRFISEDPIGFNGGDRNLYRYVGNCTPTRTDPFGLLYTEVPLPQSITWSLTPQQLQKMMADNLARVKKQYVDNQREPDCSYKATGIPGTGEVEWEQEFYQPPAIVAGSMRDKVYSKILVFPLESQNFNGDVTATSNSQLNYYFGELGWTSTTTYAINGTLARQQFIELSWKRWRCKIQYCIHYTYLIIPHYSYKYTDWTNYYSVKDLGYIIGWTNLTVLAGSTTHTISGGDVMGVGGYWN